MSDAVLNSFIYNGRVYNTDEFDSLFKERHPSLYEVVRIIDGIPLFLEEHYERLVNSASITGHSLNIKYEDIKASIFLLIRQNNVINHNIRIVINNLEENALNTYFYFIKSSYPEEMLYREGIKTFLYKGVRENPNAKVVNKSLREETDRLMKEKGCYEALLVNFDNEITEGSRSNAFFIRDNILYTSPLKDVLPGITRQRIISLCGKNGIQVIEKPIKADEIAFFDAAFISGTSPKVLPINSIDDLKLSVSNSLLVRIMNIYDHEIEKYIKEHKQQ